MPGRQKLKNIFINFQTNNKTNELLTLVSQYGG